MRLWPLFLDKRRLAVLGGLLGTLILIGGAIICTVYIGQTTSFLNSIVNQTQSDITVKNDTWDTSKYDSDPDIPGTYRLYVFAQDGSVVDRWRPIPGYLDTSDFKAQLKYQTPQTVHTITGQDWRLFTIPVNDGSGNPIADVTVGQFLADSSNTADIDQELQTVASNLQKKVTVHGSDIDASQVNVLDVPFTTSFQIVDQYNQIRVKSDTSRSVGRLPNAIDPSYLVNELKKPQTKLVTADGTGEQFLVRSAPIKDVTGQSAGTVIVARSIAPLRVLILWYLGLMTPLSLMGLLAASWLLSAPARGPGKKEALALKPVDNISFDDAKSVLVVNDEQIPLMYRSNQYRLLEALFSEPNRKWQTGELLRRFGIPENGSSWRKVYDAMNTINKKVSVSIGHKLIVTSNKTYQINPELIDALGEKPRG